MLPEGAVYTVSLSLSFLSFTVIAGCGLHINMGQLMHPNFGTRMPKVHVATLRRYIRLSVCANSIAHACAVETYNLAY